MFDCTSPSSGATTLSITTLNIMAFNITIFSIATLSINGVYVSLSMPTTQHMWLSAYVTAYVALSICDSQHMWHSAYTIQHNNALTLLWMLHFIYYILSVVMLNVVMLGVVAPFVPLYDILKFWHFCTSQISCPWLHQFLKFRALGHLWQHNVRTRECLLKGKNKYSRPPFTN